MDMSPFQATSIALDVMGSDKGPAELIAGYLLARKSVPDLAPIRLVGDESVIRKALEDVGATDHASVSIIHSPSVVTMDDKAREAYKNKKDSSMLKAISLVKDGECGAFVSCGNTAVLQFSSTLMLRKLEGVERPALATVLPGKNGPFVMLDAGAEPNTSERQIAINAVLGSFYCKAALGIENPRVGLLTIGTEEGKGTERVAEAHKLIRKLDGCLNYVGLIEGFGLFDDAVDVAVTDGFTGNVMLKALQSCFALLKSTLKDEISASVPRKLGYLLAKGAFDNLKNRFTPSRYGGAPLLGLNGLVLKSHGSSDRHYIEGALRIAHASLQHDLMQNLSNGLNAARERLVDRPETALR